jgi:HlyD family secretion protein
MTQSNVAAAEATLQAAQAELARLRAGPDSYEVALAEAELELARQRLPVLWAVRDSTGGSEQRGEIPRGSYEATKAAVAEAEILVRIIELQLEELKAGAHPDDLEAAQAAVEAAQAGVEAAESQVVEAQQQLEATRARLREAQAQLRLVEAGATSEEIEMAQAQVNDAQAALQILKIQHNKMTLHAPRNGLVLERTINVGEMALSGSILFRLADLDQVKLTVYVPEVELGRVQLGQIVTITVDSFPERMFQGQVVYISSQAEFTPRNIQTREERASQVFAVKIELPNSDHALKPGMPADAVFVER